MVLQIVLLKSIRSVVAFNDNSINCHKFLYKSLIPQSHVFTARERSCGKVLFLHMSVIRSRGGVSGSGSWGVNPPGDTPWSHTPWTHTLVTHPPDHTYPVTHNPPGYTSHGHVTGLRLLLHQRNTWLRMIYCRQTTFSGKQSTFSGKQ